MKMKSTFHAWFTNIIKQYCLILVDFRNAELHIISYGIVILNGAISNTAQPIDIH